MTISKAMMTVTISLLMLLMMTMGNAGDGADDYDNDDGGHEAHLGIIRCSRITEFACCSAAQGLKPTAITVSSLANTNRRRGAPSLLALCHVVAVRPDVVLCNTQLRSYQRELRWQQAVRVLQEVFERFALQADEVSYATCISALELSHQWPLAVRLLERMRAQEIPPSLVAYNATMATCESSSQWERTLSLFQTLRDDGLQPTQVTGDVLQMACEADSKWRFAVELAVRTPYGSAGAAGLVSCCEAALAAGPVIRAVPSVAGKVSEQLQRQKTSSLFAVFRHSAVQLLLQSSVLWWRLLSRLQTALEDEGLLANIVLNSAAARVLLSESAASGAIVPGDRTCQELASAHWLPRAPRMGLLPVVLESVSVTSGDWSIAMGPARWFGLLCLIRRGGSTAFVEPEKSPSPEKDLADIWWSIPSVGYMH
eukprot:s5320_g3.t2